jgi:hypothetical protein
MKKLALLVVVIGAIAGLGFGGGTEILITDGGESCKGDQLALG